jgi:energy-coupling factor transport system ATP-binding protein
MININDLTYSYPQHRKGIGPITFSVKPGEMLHVTGSSGCGKSTLARCISGLIPHIYNGEMGGEVFIDGRRTAETPLWKLAETAGFVFQNPAMQMMGSSVEEEIIIGLENLGLSRDTIRKRLEDSLETGAGGDYRAASAAPGARRTAVDA